MWLYTVHLIWWLFCQWWLRRGRGQVRYRRTNLRNWSNVVFPWLLQWIVELGFKVIVYKNGGRLLQFEFVGRRHSFPLLSTVDSVILFAIWIRLLMQVWLSIIILSLNLLVSLDFYHDLRQFALSDLASFVVVVWSVVAPMSELLDSVAFAEHLLWKTI